MGLMDKLRAELIDIIEWTDSTSDTMIWRFPRFQAEIKNGAQLTVRESQVAVLVNEGQFADIYQPGRYELTTSNMPILTTIKGWKYGFNSPFKVDVYFVNTKQFLNQRWGTANPIMMRDPEFGPIRIRAFGTYAFRIDAKDPTKFITNVAGTSGEFTTDGVTDQLRNFVVTKFTDHLAESKIAALDMAANLNEFSGALTPGLKADFEEYGIQLTTFLVENISLPEAVEQALDRRTSMGVIGNMGAYTQMQFADSLKAGAENPGGSDNPAGAAMGMGMGFAMAGQMTQQMINPQNQQFQGAQASAGAVPPPLPQQAMYHIAVNGVQQGPYGIAQLQQMAQSGQLTPTTLVWTAGMAGWEAARSVTALSALFGAVPPPPPPPPPAP
ncbi:MAG: SPFH domain-containing protein [Tannerella sp.]|jgi:membrane protease subunit (stomatin/prohibitin family)|nr:SPFH domain-containing protein [Tannerella sp.]